jgi:hypothetical protein
MLEAAAGADRPIDAITEQAIDRVRRRLAV